MHIHTYTHTHVCIYIYIYIYKYTLYIYIVCVFVCMYRVALHGNINFLMVHFSPFAIHQHAADFKILHLHALPMFQNQRRDTDFCNPS
jgi:hypothetical protein